MTEAPHKQDDVRALGPAEAQRLLTRMGVDGSRPPDSALLEQLQWAFLRTSPFHNLELLAGRSPRTPEAAIEAVLARRGGPCHVQATAFLALIRFMGFDAHLAAATIGEPGDHMLVIARVGHRRWVCDVGNGHPYRRPFPLGGTIALEHVGWRFEARGDGASLVLERRLPDGRTKVVYRVDPRRRTFGDFQGIIDGHHGSAGFGPFLTGLRAVRIDDDRLITLRDLSLRRYSVAGEYVRPVLDPIAAGRVLVRTFDFAPELVEQALRRVAPSAVTWPKPPRRPLRVAVTVASDRPETLALLLDDLARDAARADPTLVVPPSVHVLDNSTGRDGAIREVIDRARRRGLDVRPIDDGADVRGGRCIAESRRAQVRGLARALVDGDAIDAAWMIDDDLRLGRFERVDGRLEVIDDVCYLDDIALQWWRRPEASLLVGGVTGDPPIRPDAVYATQLLDLRANLERFAGLDPETGYHAPDQSAAFDLPDYYYDHARTDAHLDQPFYWLPRAAGVTVRVTATRFVEAMQHLFAGKTPTRPLTGGGGVPEGQPWLRRGGNAVFLDIDSCLRHPYPSVEIGGWSTRRSDMVGTATLHREGGACALGWARSMRHVRPPARSGDLHVCRGALRRSLVTEFYGVLLARAVVEGEADLQACARRRARRIVQRLAVGEAHLGDARTAIERACCGWMGEDARLRDSLMRLDEILREAHVTYFGGAGRVRAWRDEVGALLGSPGNIERIQHFVATGLAEHVEAERRSVAALLTPEGS